MWVLSARPPVPGRQALLTELKAAPLAALLRQPDARLRLCAVTLIAVYAIGSGPPCPASLHPDHSSSPSALVGYEAAARAFSLEN